MGSTNKRYTPEFKQKAVELLQSSGATAAEVARDPGCDPSTLRGWARQAGISSKVLPQGRNPFQIQEENKRLKRELKRLKEENENLLKASAFFAGRQI